MVFAIHADTNCHNQSRPNNFAFDENTAELGAGAENVIWPLERKLCAQSSGAGNDRVMDGKRRDKRQFRRPFGRPRIGKEKRCVEIARLRNPFIPAPAATRSLTACHDPKRTLLATARQDQRLKVRRRQRLVRQKASTCGSSRRVELHQNSEWAAALAAPTSGPG